jgi:hypothetical protein
LLVCQIRAGKLDLLLQLGTITREKHGNEPSTLDLSMCTPELALQVAKCMVTDVYGGSNHLLIKTEFIIGKALNTDLELH